MEMGQDAQYDTSELELDLCPQCQRQSAWVCGRPQCQACIFCHEDGDEVKKDLCAAALVNMSELDIKEFSINLQNMAHASQDGAAIAAEILAQYNRATRDLIDLAVLQREKGMMSPTEQMEHLVRVSGEEVDFEDEVTAMMDEIEKILNSSKSDEEE